jgi:hypothetical protein
VADKPTYFKRCSCRGTDGKQLGRNCPKLRRSNGTWSNHHGTWYYQLELPATLDGTRRNPLRRGGFSTHEDAESELNQARELLEIADDEDKYARNKIADAILAHVRDQRTLPDPDRVWRMVRAGHDPVTKPPTVGE